MSFEVRNEPGSLRKTSKGLAPEYTRISQLEYFHLKESLPVLSLSAIEMISQGEEIAEFKSPK
jgi:hypothetical protein